MIAILGGLGAAAAWAVATLCSSRASRMIGAGPTLSWVMLVGLVVMVPWAGAVGIPPGLDAGVGAWLVLVGAGNLLGLGLLYAGLRVGKVGIVAPIASTEGGVAAVIAVLAGEVLAPSAGAMLGVIAVGVVLTGIAKEGSAGARVRNGRAALFGIGAALSFGAGLYAAGRVSTDLPVAWVLLPTRVLAALAVALPLLLRGRLRITSRAAPLVVASGLCEIIGFASFTLGARHGIAVAVVLSSLYAAFAAVAAYGLFRERLTPLQVGGVVAIVAGVAALSAIQA